MKLTLVDSFGAGIVGASSSLRVTFVPDRACLQPVGPPRFTPEEHAFAEQVQRPLAEQFKQAFETTLNEGVARPDDDADDASGKGSTDVGDISWNVPTGGLRATFEALKHELGLR